MTNDPFLIQRRELAATISQQAGLLAEGAASPEALTSLLAENVERLKVWALQAAEREHTVQTDEKRSLDDEGLAEFIDRVKSEILEDIGTAKSSGGEVMPATVGWEEGYTELHDYVDANTYGGACDDGTTITLGDVIAMQDVVHEWLLKRGPMVEIVAKALWERFSADADDTAWADVEEGSPKDYFRSAALDVINLLIPSDDN